MLVKNAVHRTDTSQRQHWRRHGRHPQWCVPYRALQVYFGALPALSFTVQSDTSIVAVAPPEASGTVDVSVVTTTGSTPLTSSDQFTYVTAFAPTVTALLSTTSGSTGGGTNLTITGTHLTGATAVSFGAMSTMDFRVLSDSAILVTSPPQSAGTIDVTITTAGGTSGTSSSDHFTYSSPGSPSVATVSPNSSVAEGTELAITGSYFSGASGVTVGGVSADFTVVDDNTILAWVPSGLSGTVHTNVTTPSGTSRSTSADEISIASSAPPIMTGLSTSTGTTAGGTQVVITGTGLSDVTEIDFGGKPVYDFTINSPTQLTVLSPSEPAGTIDITVVSPEGSSADSWATQFSYSLASLPTISSLGTTAGSTAGGNTITVNGSYFTGAIDVTFGGVSATSFTVLSDSQISAVVPGQTAGTVDVQVISYAGSSVPGSSSDQYTYNAASSPVVSSLATTSGSTAGGTLVTIDGSNLSGATAVSFGSVPADFTVNSDSSITAWSPYQASGTVDVTVTTQVGTSATGSGDQFTYSSAGAPSVSGVTPNSGTTAGGDTITITGSGFTAATGVSFGGLPAQSFTVLSDTALTAVAPMLPAGTVDITVTTFAGSSSTSSSDHYTYTNVSGSAPTVTGVSPDTGAAGGGQVVVITGTGFTGTSAVDFGGTSATSYTINSDTQITAVAPAGSAGALDITATTNNGTSTTGSADQFTYLSTGAPTVTSLGTTSGTTAGGTSVSVTGTNFTGATEVTFGGIDAASFTVNSSTSITATTPADYAGVTDVQITTPSGVSALSSSDQYTFTAASAPTITTLGTSSGSTAGGTSVSITGTNLLGTVDVTFGGLSAASITINSSTSLTVTTPSSIAGAIDVIVWTTAGNSLPNSSSRFTFSAASPPAVSSLGTSSGATAGGTSVVITGTNFTAASSVTFGGVPAASFTVNSSTQITATTPPETAATVPVVVWTATGSSEVTSSCQYTFTAASAPTVTSLGTSGGSTGGGTSVSITGTYFTGTTAVLFGGVPAASFTVNSATSITAFSPSQAAGVVDVTVTTTAATSATSSSDHFTYTAASAPSVSALTPTSGSAAGGDVVVITGSHFLGATDVQFGVSFRQACMNRPGRFATLAVLVGEDRDACEQGWRFAEGFAAGAQPVSGLASAPQDTRPYSRHALGTGRPTGEEART